MTSKTSRKRSPEEQALTNKEKLQEQIEVCELKERWGNTKAAKILTDSGRQMGGTTVRQIYVTYQVLKASEIIQALFNSGRIAWTDIYESRKIYNRGEIKRDALGQLENKLLTIAGANRKELETLIQHKQFSNREVGEKSEDYKSVDGYYKALEEEVNRSKKLNRLSRIERLAIASKIPGTLEIVHTIFKRNPDVIAEVLERADGFCESCRKAAPFFRRSDGTPFLEVHHSIPLAQGGEDTVENSVALCPNCHRERHYGI